jgi:Domain of unknown function (DUF4399)
MSALTAAIVLIYEIYSFFGFDLLGMKRSRRLASGIAGLLIAAAFFTTFALAQGESEDVPVILSPTDGSVVRGPVTVIVGFNDASMHAEDTKPAIDDATKQMGQMDQRGQMGDMHSDTQHHGAHLHLIVDSPLPKTGMMVPMDENHIHLMHGETKTVLKFAPGKHTLQLIVGGEDHVIGAHAPHSKMITVTVQ